MSIFDWGNKKKLESMEVENEKLRKQLNEVSKSTKRQQQLEEKQIKLMNRQLKDARRESSSRNKEEAIKRFRHTIESMAPKKRSQEELNRISFGLGPLKRSTNKPNGAYWHL